MTQEEKAIAYDKVSKEVKDFFEGRQKMYSDVNQTLEYLFPELKESEDEKIRKDLIEWFEEFPDSVWRGHHKKDILAWLEKQGEQKVPTIEFNAKDWYVSKVDGKIHNIHHSVDNVEPKFHEGDFIVNDYCIGKVIALTDDAYLLDTGQGIPLSCEHNAHLWTIKDAKSGDVLSYRDGQWIFIYKEQVDDNSFHYYSLYSIIHQDLTVDDSAFTLLIDGIVPATKEQRDLLFSKMKEAGYEWDADKKKLKKIEQKPTWSEEDEKMYLSIMSVLLSTIGTNKTGFTVTREVAWLKSLKERYAWKPSDEQMEALHDMNLTGNISYAGQGQMLIRLYNDLKKLTELVYASRTIKEIENH